MTTTLNREWRKEIKRDIQRRIEDYVIQYCETLEENFKQYSLNSFNCMSLKMSCIYFVRLLTPN